MNVELNAPDKNFSKIIKWGWFSGIPRLDECIEIDGHSFRVHKVIWFLDPPEFEESPVVRIVLRWVTFK